jgi:muramoyltetrapeptide carboxypeptidase
MKAKALEAGDTVMLISPGAGLAELFPHRIENGKKTLERLGFKVIEGANSRLGIATAGTAQQRAADIHDGLTNPAVKALIATIGGDYVTQQVLDVLDWDLVRQNPKIFMGFSDFTSLALGIYAKTGLTTFYGPAVMTPLAEYPKLHDYTEQYLVKALTRAEPIGTIEPSPEWTEEGLDWGQQLDLTRSRTMQKSEGWEWLQGGQASGKILGGCIQILAFMTKNMPEYLPDFSEGILFWESAEKEFMVGHSPDEVAADLLVLKERGILAQIKGMVVGRPYYYNPVWHAELKRKIVEVMGDTTKPVLYNVEIGHTDPIITVPIGVQATLNAGKTQFSLDEKSVN